MSYTRPHTTHHSTSGRSAMTSDHVMHPVLVLSLLDDVYIQPEFYPDMFFGGFPA